jgi:pimeloyl-ACP methyl ester carboxylesterase
VREQAGDTVLSLALPGGGRVRTTWTPPVGPGRGWAWVQHGFTRRASHLDGLAGLLAAEGLAVVRPDIPSLRPRRSLHDAAWLTEVALTVVRAVDTGIPQSRGIEAEGPWVLLGHSAGAAVATHVASCLEARHGGPRVAALVLLDPVDSAGGLMAKALAGGGLQAAGIVHACRPSRCNRQGATVRELARRGWPVVDHPGLAHPDPERIPADGLVTGVPPADPWASRVCGTPGSRGEVAELARAVREEIRDQLPPRRSTL